MKVCKVSLVSVVVLLGALVFPVRGSDPEANEQAIQLVSRAIQSEIDGDVLARDRFLKEAQQLQEGFAPAKWYQGQLQTADGSWSTVEQAIEAAKSDKLLAEYEAMRSEQPASVQGNWQAAQWCAKKGLALQCRAHLENILMLDHDNVLAHTALGHQQIGDEWLTRQDQILLAERAAFIQTGFQKYQFQIDQAGLPGCLTATEQNRNPLWKKLDEIQDPLAIPVIEKAAIEMGGSIAHQLVEWLGRIEHPTAAMALVRIALSSQDAELKGVASAQLREKPYYDFMPQLLDALNTPVSLACVPVIRNNEFAGYRQVLTQETMTENRSFVIDRQVFDSANFRYKWDDIDLTRPIGKRLTFQVGLDPTMLRLEQLLAIAEIKESQAKVAVKNNSISRSNRLVLGLVSEIVGRPIVSAQEAWSWWDGYNETNYQSSKFVRRGYNYQPEPKCPVYAPVLVQVQSCFVAGTKICTLRGLRNIESIMPGDMVLSRDVRTAQLSFRPVICPTIRSPDKTVVLTVDDERIHATTSHLLWVCGKGWTKAGEIKAGDLLHSASEPAVVISCRPDAVLPTHNLIVADTHTYFVGESRVLSHDVLPRGSVHEVVPGQYLFESPQ